MCHETIKYQMLVWQQGLLLEFLITTPFFNQQRITLKNHVGIEIGPEQ